MSSTFYIIWCEVIIYFVILMQDMYKKSFGA